MVKKEFYYGDWFINNADWIKGNLLNSIGKGYKEKLKYVKRAKIARDRSSDY